MNTREQLVDLGEAARLTIPMQTRLAGLAKKHHTALICITSASEHITNLGSLVSLRGEARKVRAGFDRFQCELRAVKDKRQSKQPQDLKVGAFFVHVSNIFIVVVVVVVIGPTKANRERI